MKYIVWGVDKQDNGFVKEFNTRKEALLAAEKMWQYHFTQSEKDNIREFFVLKSFNPDEDADGHYDGDFVKVYKREREWIF